MVTKIDEIWKVRQQFFIYTCSNKWNWLRHWRNRKNSDKTTQLHSSQLHSTVTIKTLSLQSFQTRNKNLYHSCTTILRDGGQVVFDLRWAQSTETIDITDTDFNVILSHLTFKAFLQGQNGCMNGIFQFKLVAVSERQN